MRQQETNHHRPPSQRAIDLQDQTPTPIEGKEERKGNMQYNLDGSYEPNLKPKTQSNGS